MKIYGKITSYSVFLLFVLYLFTFIVLLILPVHAVEWKAGVSSVVITPDKPIWMAGYGGREKPSDGKIHDLHVKALAVEDTEGNRAVIVTADLISVTSEFSNSVAGKIKKRYGIPRDAILFNTSHTHCGPEVRLPLLFYIPKEEENRIKEYVNWLETKFVQAASEAIDGLTPAELTFSSTRPVPFAVSRRHPSPEGILYRSSPSSYYTGGPRDNTVPVMQVSDPDGSIRAILFGYACHPITLNIYQFCGDYPGFAQQYIEEAHPGAVAMFVQGCAGQLVPNSRYQLEYAMGHGRALADAVAKALAGEQTPIKGPVVCAYDEVPVELEPLPDRKVLEDDLKSDNNKIHRKAEYFLKKLNNNESVAPIFPLPLQVMRFGNNLLLVGLYGEPVVEYAINIKSQYLTYNFVWVAGYCNNGVGYLPTWQIQREGGYEGGGAMQHMPFTGPFAETVEKHVLDGVHNLVKKVTK